jgi:hypothetical protein
LAWLLVPMGWSVLLGLGLSYLPQGVHWSRLALMLVTLTVVLVRTPAFCLPAKSQQSRFNIVFVGCLLSTPLLSNVPRLGLLVPGGWLFLSACILTLIGCLYVRLKARRQVSKGR